MAAAANLIFGSAAKASWKGRCTWRSSPEIRDSVEVGGLISYGPNLPELWSRAGDYVDKVLRGAKPADIPVEQPTKYELAINLKTAKALGIEMPASVLARADEVIE